ncbi:MAG: hypothetical protein HZC01_04970 [Candidatus Kerfeldbacteria bacterium]|nr:hypothetical protein [Candidatus Kerfeldbacteria bacterium]
MPIPVSYRYRGGESSGYHQNPINVQRNWKSFVIEHFGLVAWAGICLLLAIIYFLLLSPWLAVATVQITGTNNDQARAVFSTITKDLKKHRWGLIPQSNLFAFDETREGQHIKDAFAFSVATIDVQLFKKTISITVTETPPSLIWYSQNAYYFVNNQGIIIRAIADITQEGSGMAQIIDDSMEGVSIGQEIFDSEKISFISTVHAAIKEIPSLPIFNYSLANKLSTQLKVHIIDQPYAIYFDTSSAVESQLEKLRRIVSEGVIAEKNPREYIDLRIGDRVYFK